MHIAFGRFARTAYIASSPFVNNTKESGPDTVFLDLAKLQIRVFSIPE